MKPRAGRGRWRSTLQGSRAISFAIFLLPAVSFGATPGKWPIRYKITGDDDYQELGASLDVLNDIDDDGVPDLVYGVPGYIPPGDTKRRGKIVIASGRTGEEIRSWSAVDFPWVHYGSVVARAGDIDGDGKDDILAAYGPTIEQRISSTGNRGHMYMWELRLANGYPLSLGDVTGDGVPDFVVGVPYSVASPPNSRLIACSGTGGYLWEYVSEEEGTALGFNMGLIDDLDGDGVPELAASEPGGANADRLLGKVHIFRCRDGALLRTITDGVVGECFGSSFTQISDLDGDGIRDLAVSSPSAAVRGFAHAGKVQAISLARGCVLWSLPGVNGYRIPVGEGYLGDTFGAGLEALGDVDGDGFIDLAATKHGAVPYIDADWGRIVVVSGREGTPRAILEAEQDHLEFAVSMKLLGDIDSDGKPEIVASAPRYAPGMGAMGSLRFGRIYVLTYDPKGVPFIRGDADGNGTINLNDAALVISHLLLGTQVPCEEALDVDRDAEVSVNDAGIIFYYLFGGGMAPELPFPDCALVLSPRQLLPCERSSCVR